MAAAPSEFRELQAGRTGAHPLSSQCNPKLFTTLPLNHIGQLRGTATSSDHGAWGIWSLGEQPFIQLKNLIPEKDRHWRTIPSLFHTIPHSGKRNFLD